MANFHSMRRTAVWPENHVVKPCAKPQEQPIAYPAPSRLEALSREVKDEIVSYLCPTELGAIRLVSHDMQISALNTWRLEIPPTQRTALTAPNSRRCPTVWRQAWLSQCAHLETLGPWGIQASLACKFLPDELNPYDVELQCREWLNSETASDNTEAEVVLEELFKAIHEHEIVLDWSRRNLHSLPPFMNKIKGLEALNLEGNQLEAIKFKDHPVLKELYLRENPLSTISLENLSALKELYLEDNQLDAINFKDLPALEEVYLRNNQLSAVHIKDLPALKILDLEDNQLSTIALKDLPKLEALNLNFNQLRIIDLKDLPKLKRLDLSQNQLSTASFKNLSALKMLNLNQNQLSAICLEDFPMLEGLYLNRNQLITVDLKDLPALKELFIDCSQRLFVSSEYSYAVV